LSSSNFSFGVWSFTTHSFATAAHSNAVRLDYSAPISLLFGPLIGRATSTGKVRSTVAMRPRELVFVVDVSTGSQATSRASAYTGMLSEINGYGFQDDEVAMVVYDSGLVGSHATLQSVVNNYTALNSRWSHMNSCGNGGMPACVDASDPAVGINEAVSILQNQGDNRFYQAIYLVTPGNVRCTSGTSSCATNLQNSAVTAVDAAWALGISVYPIAVQPTVSQATFLSTLSRGDGLKTGLQQTSTISDLDYYLDLVADHYPLTIVE
jgi:hypothetical protein